MDIRFDSRCQDRFFCEKFSPSVRQSITCNIITSARRRSAFLITTRCNVQRVDNAPRAHRSFRTTRVRRKPRDSPSPPARPPLRVLSTAAVVVAGVGGDGCGGDKDSVCVCALNGWFTPQAAGGRQRFQTRPTFRQAIPPPRPPHPGPFSPSVMRLNKRRCNNNTLALPCGAVRSRRGAGRERALIQLRFVFVAVAVT